MPKTSLRIAFNDVEFTGADIKAASVTEELSPLSITVPVSVLDLTLFSDDAAFSIINPTGKYEPLLQRQPMAVYEEIDGVEEYIGQYYLNDWSDQSESIKIFSCVDIMGILDQYDYYGGIWLTPITVGELIADILNDANVEYDLKPELATVELTGWIPICSYREALQQVLFAIGAYVLVARQRVLIIGILNRGWKITNQGRPGFAHTGQTRVYQIRWRSTQQFVFSSLDVTTRGIRSGIPHTGQSRIWQQRWRPSQWEGTKPVIDVPSSEQSNRHLSLRPLVTGVEITAHDIISGTGTLELFNGILAAGDHEIRFSQPMHDLICTGATIASSGSNYAVLTVAAPGTVILTGLVYIDTTKIFGIYLPSYAYKKENVLTITDASLVNSENAEEICQNIFNYYQQRYIQDVKLYAPTAEIGDTVNMETLYGNNLFGVVEKATTDLTGGNVASIEVVGIITSESVE